MLLASAMLLYVCCFDTVVGNESNSDSENEAVVSGTDRYIEDNGNFDDGVTKKVKAYQLCQKPSLSRHHGYHVQSQSVYPVSVWYTETSNPSLRTTPRMLSSRFS